MKNMTLKILCLDDLLSQPKAFIKSYFENTLEAFNIEEIPHENLYKYACAWGMGEAVNFEVQLAGNPKKDLLDHLDPTVLAEFDVVTIDWNWTTTPNLNLRDIDYFGIKPSFINSANKDGFGYYLVSLVNQIAGKNKKRQYIAVMTSGAPLPAEIQQATQAGAQAFFCKVDNRFEMGNFSVLLNNAISDKHMGLMDTGRDEVSDRNFVSEMNQLIERCSKIEDKNEITILEAIRNAGGVQVEIETQELRRKIGNEAVFELAKQRVEKWVQNETDYGVSDNQNGIWRVIFASKRTH